MDKWQKLKDFLKDGKEHITKDFYVSRPSVFEEILDIMEELEKREVSELEEIREEIIIDQEEMANDEDWGRYYGMGWAIRIIDNHISKLKGE